MNSQCPDNLAYMHWSLRSFSVNTKVVPFSLKTSRSFVPLRQRQRLLRTLVSTCNELISSFLEVKLALPATQRLQSHKGTSYVCHNLRTVCPYRQATPDPPAADLTTKDAGNSKYRIGPGCIKQMHDSHAYILRSTHHVPGDHSDVWLRCPHTCVA